MPSTIRQRVSMSAKKLASTHRSLAAIALLVVAPRSCLAAQTATPSAGQPVVVAANARAAASAARASRAPSIDGRDDDAAWRDAAPITEFRQFDPVEDGESSMRTEARVIYDDAHLYVFVRAFDPRPDSIIALLSRRDVRTASDQIKVMIDSYHDRRTGFEFAVNPAGVKRDYFATDDGRRTSPGMPCGTSRRPSTRSAGRRSSASRSASSAIRRRVHTPSA